MLAVSWGRRERFRGLSRGLPAAVRYSLRDVRTVCGEPSVSRHRDAVALREECDAGGGMGELGGWGDWGVLGSARGMCARAGRAWRMYAGRWVRECAERHRARTALALPEAQIRP
ncbi:hypothetical protein GCM10022233_01360 [Streptomyces shaanxiensis]|uniref:Uncharacterized protein n=1 Tax=Streptomyces shaanxiensis TaxID=653357 RepID=A0ABP7U6S4_9ACTN